MRMDSGIRGKRSSSVKAACRVGRSSAMTMAGRALTSPPSSGKTSSKNSPTPSRQEARWKALGEPAARPTTKATRSRRTMPFLVSMALVRRSTNSARCIEAGTCCSRMRCTAFPVLWSIPSSWMIFTSSRRKEATLNGCGGFGRSPSGQRPRPGGSGTPCSPSSTSTMFSKPGGGNNPGGGRKPTGKVGAAGGAAAGSTSSACVGSAGALGGPAACFVSMGARRLAQLKSARSQDAPEGAAAGCGGCWAALGCVRRCRAMVLGCSSPLLWHSPSLLLAEVDRSSSSWVKFFSKRFAPWVWVPTLCCRARAAIRCIFRGAGA
mmetsp:Transcript_2051/g.5741  ORF Transcript_2051/g.5741 Transcript_2051/m.5741 type:complete len:321 (-) Transcript_2051:39-1001(-)